MKKKVEIAAYTHYGTSETDTRFAIMRGDKILEDGFDSLTKYYNKDDAINIGSVLGRISS